MNSQKTTRILILGGGFGGVATAQGLSKLFRRDPSVEITLVNRDNYFVFVPLLVSAAAGSIETLHVVAPIRRLIPGIEFRAEEAVEIDLERQLVSTASPVTGRERRLPYDHLVLALGNAVDLSRWPGVAQHGMTIKTLGDAIAIRNHVLQMLEAAAIETSPAVRREMLTFVVAGGGFSGVEMVGELNDLVREAITHYPSITEDQIRVILLHSRERILPEMAAGAADYALKQLRKRGVEVRLKARLAGATPHEVLLEGDSKIATRTLIGAIGNSPPPLLDGLKVKKEHGKIVVDEFMRVADHPGVWALGDNAIVPNRASESGAPSPPTAQYALRQGKTLAHNIAAIVHGRQPKPFAFGGLGLMCTVGHGAGVGELPLGIKTKGFLGWLLWRSVYWAKTPSFGRKVQIGADWLLDLFLKRDIAQINLARTQTVGRAHYRAGEYIFRQGEPGNHFYMIAEGEVEVVRERSSGEQNVLARLGKGEYFGETALLTRGRRNASIRCVTPVDVVTIGRDDFAALAGAWVQLANNLEETSERRVAAAPLTGYVPVLDLSSIPEVAAEQTTAAGPSARRVAQLRRDTGAEIALDRDTIIVGRSPENNIVVDDPKASRRHALIERESDTYWVDDPGSLNGTWVNDDRISERVALKDGDVIRIGGTRFVFQIVNETTLRAPTQQEGSITDVIRSLDAPTESAQPEVGQVTGEIRDLDSPKPAQPKAGSMTGEIRNLDMDKSGQPKVGEITGMIESLDQPERTPTGPEKPSAGVSDHVDQGAYRGNPATAKPEVPASPRVLLRAIGGPAGDEVFEVSQAAISLGRGPDNDLLVADSKASRRHARIEFRDGAYWLTDLDSSNGTYVNQARLRGPHRLQSGDTLGIGDRRFVFEIAPKSARPAAASVEQSEEGSITGMIQSLEPDKPAPPNSGPAN